MPKLVSHERVQRGGFEAEGIKDINTSGREAEKS